jgi:ribonucleoside-diphosphate reductase alpha chain
MPKASATSRRATSPKVSRTAAFKLSRYFTHAGVHPYDEVKWERRTIKIAGPASTQVDFEGEFPSSWSQNAAQITGSKYFRKKGGVRESSVRQMIDRVARTIRGWGETSGYFNSKREAQIFEDELTHLLLNQKAAFNSPVWFNVGHKEVPQCSACFILSVEDDMDSIMDWIHTESTIFRGGSGSGINLSTLRSHREPVSIGGYASGPVSFMRGADSVAGMIKSGGSTRRSAKMVLLDVEHPDIMEFIRCKAEEEKKVRALMAAGFNMQDINDPAWTSIQYQNANNSVRLSDDFLRRVESDRDWETRFIISGEIADRYSARELMREIARAAWECADPGVHYKDTINAWHTCPNTGPINACNPCSEYMHLDNSACNLASINLIKFLDSDGSFKIRDFLQAVDVMILAQEIIVGHSSYPTERIKENALAYRELGLGFANIGGLFMAKGFAYDSDEARALAGAITALMSGEAYRFSALVASKMGPYAGYKKNKEPQLKVIGMHREKVKEIERQHLGDARLAEEASRIWNEAVQLARKHGVRNSQVTVIAPTGTIALMMDCTCTGIEPLFAPVIYKQLVGGGTMVFAADTIPMGLRTLGYGEAERAEIVEFIKQHGRVEGAPHIKEEHMAVFDCAVVPPEGTRAISWQGHVRMVASVQPFISGAISKTFNMPENTSPEEIEEAYMMGWKLGLKAFAVYRDGCKAAQPLSSKKKDEKDSAVQAKFDTAPRQRKLPPVRSSETHKFSIAGHNGFLTYSMYDDGTLAEVFIRMAKQGSTLAGLLDTFAIAISTALQYGVPLKKLCHKFIYARFEPMGFTTNPDIQIATSISDYIFRYLALRFLSPEELAEFGMEPKVAEIEMSLATTPDPAEAVLAATTTFADVKKDVPMYADTVCKLCGGMMIRTGTCLTCTQCGEASGGCS